MLTNRQMLLALLTSFISVLLGLSIVIVYIIILPL